MLKPPDICSMCGEEYTGFGNNADPVADGRCCDPCNDIVILQRMAESGHSDEVIARTLTAKGCTDAGLIWAIDRAARYFRGKWR